MNRPKTSSETQNRGSLPRLVRPAMTYEYDHETGVLTYTISPELNVAIRRSKVPPGDDLGATALRIIERKRTDLMHDFGKCEVTLVVRSNDKLTHGGETKGDR